MSYTIKAAPTVTSFTADKKSPQASGTQLPLMAKATGEGELQYKFLVKRCIRKLVCNSRLFIIKYSSMES